MTQTQDKVVLAHYAVAFIDILGQRDILLRFGLLPNPNDPVIQEQFRDVVKNSYTVVKNLKKWCNDYINAFSAPSQSHESMIPDDKKQLYRKLRQVNLNIQRISDGLIIVTCLANDDNRVAMNDIYGLIGACGSMCLLSLASKHPIRGAIDIGWGVGIDDDFYGGVLAKVIDLEKNIAQYPRIVVGDEVIKYLNSKNNPQQSNPITHFNKSLASTCCDLLAYDDDGYPIVDYLGKEFKDAISTSISSDIIPKAYDFIKEQSATHKKNKNTKLAFRYSLLRNYFESRMPIWGIKSD